MDLKKKDMWICNRWRYVGGHRYHLVLYEKRYKHRGKEYHWIYHIFTGSTKLHRTSKEKFFEGGATQIQRKVSNEAISVFLRTCTLGPTLRKQLEKFTKKKNKSRKSLKSKGEKQ